MKVHGGVELQLHIFLTSALDKCKQSDCHPSRFTTRAVVLFSYHVADCAHTTAGLIAVERKKLSSPCVELRILLTSR
jgi:hypothetical protein